MTCALVRVSNSHNLAHIFSCISVHYTYYLGVVMANDSAERDSLLFVCS